jgi:uncharacterized phage protein (TIGR01671 family)
MREIKFRAWDKENEEWVYNPESGYIDVKQDDEIEFDYDENRIILQQYTGLKDKNGKEIYEGDIVKSENKMIVFVEWNDLDGSWHCFNKNHKFHSTWTLGHFINDKIEVIGNIYENKDLIK